MSEPPREALSREYRGIDHPAGELRLTLSKSGDFSLRLAIWDPVVGAVAGHRELTGTWRCTDTGVELASATRAIEYVAAEREGMAPLLVWRRSSLPTFADGIALARIADR